MPQREIRTWWDGEMVDLLDLFFARHSSTCQLRLDMPLPALTKPRTQNKSAIGTTSRPLKIRKLLRYGIYTPEIWICYCDVTILYSGHFWTFPNICLAAIIQAKFHVSTTHVKRETVGAFCTWKLERLQVHHGIGKLEPPAIQCSLAVNVSFELYGRRTWVHFVQGVFFWGGGGLVFPS